jgi:hypothetical protein
MNWFKKAAKIGAGSFVNPVLGNVMAAKEGANYVNDKMGRGYKDAQGKLDQAYDLYDNNKNAYDKIYDPRLRQYQMTALNRLQGIAGSKNLDAQSQAQLNQIRQKEGQLEKGSREAIMQNAAERGASSSTGNLMAQLMNQQGAAERRTNQDTDVAAQQQKRALDALYGSINTAQGIGDEDFRRANAQNLFNQYNIGGKARTLGAQGELAIDKAGQENAFWSGLVDKGLTIGKGLATGGGSIAANAAAGSGGSPAGLQAYNPQNPFSKKPSLTNYDYENVFQYQPGYNPIL